MKENSEVSPAIIAEYGFQLCEWEWNWTAKWTCIATAKYARFEEKKEDGLNVDE